MDQEALEYSISLYPDLLDGRERSAVERELAENPAALEMLRQERKLTHLLRSDSVPAIDWDRLQGSISAAIDEQADAPLAMPWWNRFRLPVGLAAAASVLLALGLSIHAWVGRQTGTSVPDHPNVQVSQVELPTDRPEGPVVSEVSIGPGGQYASDSPLAPYADEIDQQPSRVIIASGIAPESARPGFPY